AFGGRASCARRAPAPFPSLSVGLPPWVNLQGARPFSPDKHPAFKPPLCSGECYRHDRIRVAYLSADFHNHATSYLMAELFERHDRERFEITAVSFGPDVEDGMRQRLRTAFSRFVDVRRETDRAVAQ